MMQMTLKLNELKRGMVDWTVRGFVKTRNELKPYKSKPHQQWFDFRLCDEETTIRVVFLMIVLRNLMIFVLWRKKNMFQSEMES